MWPGAGKVENINPYGVFGRDNHCVAPKPVAACSISTGGDASLPLTTTCVPPNPVFTWRDSNATGHKSRLNRKAVNGFHFFGDKEYSKEELVAEMGAAFLSGNCGIEAVTIDNSASYIQGWLKALKGDNKLVIRAAGQAQKAADFILNVKKERV